MCTPQIVVGSHAGRALLGRRHTMTTYWEGLLTPVCPIIYRGWVKVNKKIQTKMMIFIQICRYMLHIWTKLESNLKLNPTESEKSPKLPSSSWLTMSMALPFSHADQASLKPIVFVGGMSNDSCSARFNPANSVGSLRSRSTTPGSGSSSTFLGGGSPSYFLERRRKRPPSRKITIIYIFKVENSI
jgi:hypothetical protein